MSTVQPDHELARERAEVVIGQVPEYIWDGRSLPVPIEEIAGSWFNLHVRDVDGADMRQAPGYPDPGTDQEIAGLLLTRRKEIWVNRYEANTWPGRRRFTICHELGHWNLHRTGQQSLFCRHANVAIHEHQLSFDDIAPPKPPPPPTEVEADTFAANLLMPADLFHHHYTRTTTDIAALQALFGASEKAIIKRIAAITA